MASCPNTFICFSPRPSRWSGRATRPKLQQHRPAPRTRLRLSLRCPTPPAMAQPIPSPMPPKSNPYPADPPPLSAAAERETDRLQTIRTAMHTGHPIASGRAIVIDGSGVILVMCKAAVQRGFHHGFAKTDETRCRREPYQELEVMRSKAFASNRSWPEKRDRCAEFAAGSGMDTEGVAGSRLCAGRRRARAPKWLLAIGPPLSIGGASWWERVPDSPGDPRRIGKRGCGSGAIASVDWRHRIGSEHAGGIRWKPKTLS